MKRSSGFSLIEILLTLSVIMILMIAAFFTYKTLSTEYKTNLFNKQISETIGAFRPIFTQPAAIMNMNSGDAGGFNIYFSEMKHFFPDNVKLVEKGDRFFLETALPLEVLPYMSGFSSYNGNTGLTNLFMMRIGGWKNIDYASCVKIINYQYPLADQIIDINGKYLIKETTSSERNKDTIKLINNYCSSVTSADYSGDLYIYYTD